MRSALASLPDVDAPRSFRVHPSQLVPERQTARAARSFVYAVPALGAAAVIALTVLIAVDIAGGGSGEQAGDRTAFNAERAAPNANDKAAASAAASSANSAAAAPAVPAAASPDTKSLEQNNAGATEFAPDAARPAGTVPPTPPAPGAQGMYDSSPGSTAASRTAASDALRIAPPPRTDVPLTAADIATALSRTPAAVVTREEPSKGTDGGIGALRIAEIVAGVVIVVMGGLTVRMLRVNWRKT